MLLSVSQCNREDENGLKRKVKMTDKKKINPCGFVVFSLSLRRSPFLLQVPRGCPWSAPATA
jgi:hypothetical protein